MNSNTTKETKDTLRQIGIRLQDLRLKHNLTQTRLATDMGTYVEKVQRVEAGTTPPPIDYLLYFHNELHESFDYILTGVELDNRYVSSQIAQIEETLNLIKKD